MFLAQTMLFSYYLKGTRHSKIKVKFFFFVL